MPASKTASRLARSIEEADALEEPARRLAGAVGPALSSRPLKDALSGTWLGHPAHPALVAAPIGLLGGASVLDLSGHSRAARTLIGAGLVSAAPAALTGLSDWADTTGAERRVGLAHALCNTAASTLYLMSWRARGKGHTGRGAALALLGATVLTAGGWLGGHLSYALGVGVDTNAFSAGPTDWTALGGLPAGGIPSDGSPVAGVAGSTGVVASRQPGGVRVLADRCSHRGGPLSDGSVEGGCVTCPWHGSRFDLATGDVVRGPAVVGQPAYRTRETPDGSVEVRRDEHRSLRASGA